MSKKKADLLFFAVWFSGGAIGLIGVVLGAVHLLVVGLALDLAVLWYPWIKALEAGRVSRAYERFALYASLALVTAFGAAFLVLHPPVLRVAALPQPTPCPTVCPTP